MVLIIVKNSIKLGKNFVTRDEGGGGQGHRDEGVTRGEGVKIAKFTVTYFMDDPLFLCIINPFFFLFLSALATVLLIQLVTLR